MVTCPSMDFRHLDEKKKKRKGNKAETVPDFPGREKVKFGEVVEAPPKLSFPKVLTSPRCSI